jgi:hypothetical protein
MPVRFLVLAILVSITSRAHGADLYKCTDKDGLVSYQDTPCSGHQTILFQQEKVNVISGLPVKNGRLDVEAFTPLTWQRAHGSPWALESDSQQFTVWYSYSNLDPIFANAIPKVEAFHGYITSLAIKTSTKDANGNFDKIDVLLGFIDCSQADARPDTVFHAQKSTYDAGNGGRLYFKEPIDVSLSSNPLQIKIAGNVCHLAQADAMSHLRKGAVGS